MFDRTHQPQPSETYRPHPHTRGLTGSVLLAAAVPAVLWALSYPLTTALFVVAVAVVTAGVRTLRASLADRSTATQTAVDAGEPTEGT